MRIVRGLFPIALLGLALSGLLPHGAAAQEPGTVTGTVTNQAGHPVVAVQVFISGTNLGSLTNQEGRFTIRNVPAGDHELIATRIGFSRGSERISLSPGETLTVTLVVRESALELEGLVVTTITGQVHRRRELGTNSANIEVSGMELAPVQNLGDLLAGRATGLTLQQASGTTGGGQRIRIRGANSLSLSNEPLIFVDGVRLNDSKGAFPVGGQTTSRLNDLSPGEIESIEVIKGPAASALYGSAAANGVIQITTRRGSPGMTRWEAWAETSTIEDRTAYPSNWVAYSPIDPGQPLYVNGQFNHDAYRTCTNYQAAAGTCTQDQVISFNTLRDGRTSPFIRGDRQRMGLSAAGGGDLATFYFSVDRDAEQGIFDYSTMGRTSLRGNVGAQLRPDLTVNVSSAYVTSDLRMNSNDNSILSPLINGLLGGPTFIEGAEGAPHANNYGWGYGQDVLSNYVPRQEVDRFTLGVSGDYRPLSWLSSNVNVGLDYTTRHDHNTLQPDRIPIAASWAIGWRDSRRNTQHIWTASAASTATFRLAPELISTTTVGVNYDRDSFEQTDCYGAGIVEGTSSCSAASSLFAVGEDYTKIVTVGALARQQLAWRDRVFVAGSIRGDDNSAFGDDFGLAYYPAASLSWVVGEEDWFPTLPAVSSLRVRTAWGTSGLRPGFRDAVTLFEPVSVTVNDQELSAVTLNTTGNPGLKPERTTELEYGLDAGFLQDRLSIDFTYFDKRSRDALISRRLAPSFGLTSSVFDNLGRVKNSGTELGLNALVVDRPDVRLNLRVSNSTLNNRILDMGEDVEPIIFNRGNQRHQIGYSAGAFFQRPVTWSDPDGDGRLGVADIELGDEEVFLGTSLPRWHRSLGADLSLFDWVSVSTLFEARGGHKQLNYTERFRCTTGLARGDRGCQAIWDPNASLEAQAAFLGAAVHGTNAGYIEDARFVRWRELAVTFRPPAEFARRLPRAEGMSLTLAGRNLQTWTNYTGLDPEINETGAGQNFTQGEFNTQPIPRHLTVRVNYRF